MKTRLAAVALLTSALLLQSCGNPRFNLPYYQGRPDGSQINRRILCELADMLRDDTPTQAAYIHRRALMAGHYVMAAIVTLDVSQTFGATPSVTYSKAVTSGLFSFNVGANLTRTQQRSATVVLEYKVDDILQSLSSPTADLSCPKNDMNLAGEIGLADLVSLAMPLPLNLKAGVPGGQFGGTTTFTLTANVNSVGPTWTLNKFKGPGSFGAAGNVFTNKLTVAFVDGPAKPTTAQGRETFRRAREALKSIQDENLGLQLNGINSKF